LKPNSEEAFKIDTFAPKMIRNLFISLVVAIFAVSLLYVGDWTGDTASNEGVTAVENAVRILTGDDNEEAAFQADRTDWSSYALRLRMSSRSHHSRTSGGTGVDNDTHRQVLQETDRPSHLTYLTPFHRHCTVPSYLFWRNLRI